MKIIFANQLRAVAAISVVLGHLGGVFVLMGPVVSRVISAPEVHAGRPSILHLTLWPWLNLGAFGVAAFFLISGFVIPFSLRRQSAAAFLVARGFRIYPTLWAALLLEWLAVWAQHRLYGLPMAFTWPVYLWNALLLDTILGGGYVDLVNWTLAVEIKFYLLMALLRPWILAGRVLPLVGWSGIAIVVAAAQRHGAISIGIPLADEPMCIGFMMIGTIFHYHLIGRLTTARALFAGAALTGLFLSCWHAGPIREQFPTLTANYLYALVLFFCCYLARARFRAIRWLDQLADISYPLYLIHSIIGYSLLSFALIRLGLSYNEALPLAFGVVLLLAWMLHRLVERPSQNAGKSLAAHMPTPTRNAAAA